jgi:2-succinyl-6-hydroxy-2,4-cyclohexadiene-1-carboxylate synthase
MAPLPERFHAFRVAGHTARIRLMPGADKNAPAILALHGFTGSGAGFEPLREAMGADRFTWILPDFMGHGASDAPETIDPYLLPNVLRLIHRARSLATGPLILLGYSMGARIGLHYHRWQPLRRVILISGSPGLDTAADRHRRQESDRALIDLQRDTIRSFCERWETKAVIASQGNLPEPLRSAIRRRRRQNRLVGLRNSLLANGTGTLPSLWDALPSLPPFTVVHGEADLKFGAISRRMQDAQPRIRRVTVPAAGHAPHLEAPERLAGLIRESCTGEA